MKCKKDLACLMVSKFFGVEAGRAELENFEKVFSKNGIPEVMPEFAWDSLTGADEDTLVNIMGATSLFPSKKEIRRLIEAGAVKRDGERIDDPFLGMQRPESPFVLQAGKRIFFRVLP